MTPEIQQQNLAARLLDYARANQYVIDHMPGAVNIFYLEGANADGSPNADEPDLFNDRRIVLVFDGNDTPQILLNEPCTTEPGLAPTLSAAARRRGGVARIAFGQWPAWMVGYHQGRKDHPALVQVRPLTVHRDLNQDGQRTGDNLDTGLFGINQHGTSPRYTGDRVGNWSAGCSVGKVWTRHLYFIGLCKADPRYQANPEFVFSAIYIDAADLARVCPIPPMA